MAAVTSAVIGYAALGYGLAGAGIWAMSQAGKKPKTAAPTPFPMPKAPKVKDAAGQTQAALKAKKQAIARSRSIYTSPLGIGGEADIAKKYLLGQ